MTRDDQKLRLQRLFENTTYFSQYDFNNSIQDGYDEVASFSGCIMKAASISFTANLSYYDMITLLPDYVGAIAIFNTAIKRWMAPTSVRKLDRDRIDWETALGVPYFFAPINHRYIAIYKKPGVANYGSMYVFYRAAAPTLASTDTILVPPDFSTTLEDYCITDLWEQNEEWTKAGLHLDSYVNNLKSLHTWVHSQRMPDRMAMLK